MEIELYITHDADTVIGKDKELKHKITMEMKDRQNITQPTIILYEGDMDLQDINYAYIPHYERYYFVRTYNMGPNQIYELLLECDVIETFKEEILASEADITRNIEEGDYMNIPGNAEVKKDVQTFESNKGFTGEQSILFSTIGQHIEEGE